MMERAAWDALSKELLAGWYRNLSDWRECGDHQIASLLRDGIGDVDWLLGQVSLEGEEPEVIAGAVRHLREAGGEMLDRLDRNADEWTGSILYDVIEQLESRLGSPST